MLEMVYEGGDFSMIALLPDDFNYEQMVKNINAEKLEKWMSAMERRSVDVRILIQYR